VALRELLAHQRSTAKGGNRPQRVDVFRDHWVGRISGGSHFCVKFS
jgi:hypothetical protein